MNDQEQWKDIEGYEGFYQVSNHGRVRSLDRKLISNRYKNKIERGRILKTKPGSKGYQMCKLHKNNSGKTFYVHRLIAIAFIDNPDNKPFINHKDLNRSNNEISNLEWVTQAENVLHASKSGAIKYHNCESHHNSVLTNKEVAEIRKKLSKYNTVELAKIYGVHKSTISRIKQFQTYKSV